MKADVVTINQAVSATELAAVRELVLEYSAWLDVNLQFQGFEVELATLPASYAPPLGRLLLAQSDGQYAGIVALRPLGPDICEVKRLFVRPAFRGRRIGGALVHRVMAEAVAIGYRVMRLDTFPLKMRAAVVLYRACGFVDIPAYYDNPISGVAYMECRLDGAPSPAGSGG